MRRLIAQAFFAQALCLACAPLVAEPLAVPSGQDVTLYDVVLEGESGIARFLFLAPAIGPEGLNHADVQADFVYLCETYAVPALRANEWNAREVVIALANREVEFGVITPEATQFFEPFRIENTACIWEAF